MLWGKTDCRRIRGEAGRPVRLLQLSRQEKMGAQTKTTVGDVEIVVRFQIFLKSRAGRIY